VYGGSDADTFAFGAGFGQDRIRDFAAGAGPGDRILFDGALGVASFDAVLARATQEGADTVIRFDASTFVILENVAKTSLAADDFGF
jgi:Ca2+-binding RTX toxin-like protein